MLKTCPSSDQIRKLLLGALLDEESVILSEHLDHCVSCQITTRTLTVSDTLVALIRTAGRETAVEPPIEVERVMINLRDRSQAAALVNATSDTRLSNIDESETIAKSSKSSITDDVSEILSSIRPPESAEELGRLSDFRLLKLLGHGGMGAVFLAEDSRLQRPVALKLVRGDIANRQDGYERFLREARAAAKVLHENVVTIYQVGEERGVPFLAQELLDGETLEARLDRQGRLGVDEGLHIAEQIARGLAAAHARGLIHRDIKPANIFLAKNPHSPDGAECAKILDFGLARGTDGSTQLTQSGMIVGTPAFMSPEQAAGEAVDPRTDLFSLGGLLYVMLTGQRPFLGENVMKLLFALANDTPAAIRSLRPEVPDEVSQLVEQLLAKPVANRPATATEVAKRLASSRAVPTTPSTARLTPPQVARADGGEQPPRRPIRRFVGLAGGSTALLLFGVIIITITHQNGTKTKIEVPAGSKVDIAVEPGIASHSAMSENASPLVASVDVDRQAAEWALGKKGTIVVAVNGTEMTVKSPADLPKERFQLYEIVLARPDDPVKDAELSVLEGLPSLRRFDCAQDGTLTDAGMAHLKGLATLKRLVLRGQDITDAGVEQLRELKDLEWLDLTYTLVTESGLQTVKDFTKLWLLAYGHRGMENQWLRGPVMETVAGLEKLRCLALHNPLEGPEFYAPLRKMKRLIALGFNGSTVTDAIFDHFELLDMTNIQLTNTEISDQGLGRLKAFPNLRHLDLSGSRRVTSNGLAQLKAIPNLDVLLLNKVTIEDEGLQHLQQIKRLQEINLMGTNISAAGIQTLHEALPHCKILWGDLKQPMTIESASKIDVDRRAAEWVLNKKGVVVVAVGGMEMTVKLLVDLPKERLQLTEIVLTKADPVSDAELSVLEGLPSLRKFDCAQDGTLSDAGIAHLNGLTTLQCLGLRGQNITDAGVEQLRQLKDLGILDLSYTLVTEQGLQAVKEFTKLWHLRYGHRRNQILRGPALEAIVGLELLLGLELNSPLERPEFYAPLRAMKQLRFAQFHGPSVTNAIFDQIDAPDLYQVQFGYTDVSDKGLERLSVFPKLRFLNLIGSRQITNNGLAHLQAIPQLDSLILNGIPIDDDGLKHLQPIKTLLVVDLAGTNVSAAGIHALHEALPHCKITWGDPKQPMTIDPE